MTELEILNEWYYLAYNQMLENKISYELWEEIKYTIQKYKEIKKINK